MKYHIDESKNYIQKVMSRWQSVYRMAHAATGSSELAEAALQEALLDAYIHLNEGSLHENLRNAVSDAAVVQLREARRTHSLELDWNGFAEMPENLPPQDQPNWRFVADQDVITRRIIMLKYALRWSPRQIADAMDMHTGEIKQRQQRVTAQLQRSLGAQESAERNVRISPVDRSLHRVVRAELSRGGNDLPDVNIVMQALEQDTAAIHVHGMTARRFTGGVIRMALALIMAMIFYMCAVMAQDPFEQAIHLTQAESADEPNATAPPVLTLPALSAYDMIDAGRQLGVKNAQELEYFLTQPVAVLNAEGWRQTSEYVRDERGIGGTTTRAAVIEYADEAGRALKLRSMLPGSEACQRLEDQMAYMGSNAQILGQTAVQLQSGALCRVYTMIGQVTYCLEGEIPLSELTEIARAITFA